MAYFDVGSGSMILIALAARKIRRPAIQWMIFRVIGNTPLNLTGQIE
jgi:hypothetical protein